MQAEPNLKTYIHRVSKQIAPDLGITENATEEIQMLNHILLRALMHRTNLLVHHTMKKTVNARHVMLAASLLFPGNMEKAVNTNLTAAVIRYNATLEEGAGSLQSRAAITFPVKRFEKAIRVLSTADRVSVGAAIAMTSILETFTSNLIERASRVVQDDKKMRMTMKHLRMAIMGEKNEFTLLLNGIVIPGAIVHAENS